MVKWQRQIQTYIAFPKYADTYFYWLIGLIFQQLDDVRYLWLPTLTIYKYIIKNYLLFSVWLGMSLIKDYLLFSVWLGMTLLLPSKIHQEVLHWFILPNYSERTRKRSLRLWDQKHIFKLVFFFDRSRSYPRLYYFS